MSQYKIINYQRLTQISFRKFIYIHFLIFFGLCTFFTKFGKELKAAENEIIFLLEPLHSKKQTPFKNSKTTAIISRECRSLLDQKSKAIESPKVNTELLLRETFAKADVEYENLQINPIRREGVLLWYELQITEKQCLSLLSFVGAKKFYNQFKEKFGKKFFIAFPSKEKAFVFPVWIDTKERDELAKILTLLYEISDYPASNEIFLRDKKSFTPRGQFCPIR